MSLFLVNIDPDTIRLIIHCLSDNMLQCIHARSKPLMCGYFATMVAKGDYTLIPAATSRS